MRVLAFAASLREESLNRRLIAVAAELARKEGADVDLASFGEFDMPLFHGDLEQAGGLPPGAIELQRRIRACAAIMIAAPEYNYSISGVLKNAIDWVSRARPMPWRGKSVYLMSASPSAIGGIRGLWQTRIPLEGCGSLVFPDMFALASAHEAFDADGRLRQRDASERLQTQVAGFIRLAEAVGPICDGQPGKPPELPQRQIQAALEEESEIQPPGT